MRIGQEITAKIGYHYVRNTSEMNDNFVSIVCHIADILIDLLSFKIDYFTLLNIRWRIVHNMHSY